MHFREVVISLMAYFLWWIYDIFCVRIIKTAPHHRWGAVIWFLTHTLSHQDECCVHPRKWKCNHKRRRHRRGEWPTEVIFVAFGGSLHSPLTALEYPMSKQLTKCKASALWRVTKTQWIGQMMLWQPSVTLLWFGDQGGCVRNRHKVCTFWMTHSVMCISDRIDWVRWSCPV